MSSAISQLVDDIVKDATETLNNVTNHVAKKVADDWEDKAKHVMDAYYNTETAGYYERTGSLRNTINRVLRQSGDGYVAGVEFDLSRMSHDGLSQFSEFAIFDNFMYGQHGNEDYTVPKTKEQVVRNIAFTTPFAKIVLDKYYQNYDNKVDAYFEDALRIFG